MQVHVHLGVGTVIVACCVGLATDSASAGEIEQVLRDLQRNEALYEDVDVRWNERYRLGEVKRKLDQMIDSRSREGRTVQQHGLHRIECQGVEKTVAAEAVRISKVTAYDGAITRLLENRGSNVGNVVDGFRYDGNAFDPYTLPLSRFGVKVPLSVWLQGPNAVRAHPKGGHKGNAVHCSRLAGSESVDGLLCHKVVIDYFGDKAPETATDRRVFWLAPERNYFPLKAEAYNLRSSKNLPNECTTWSKFEEIETGVWYPRLIKHTGLEAAIGGDGKQLAMWESEFKVESVNVNPQHPLEFFADVDFPAGTTVYHVDAKGEVVESYVQGQGG